MKLISNNLHKFAILLITALSLASCGGGGGGGGSSTPSATITSITPVGMVQSASSRALSLTGTNFASGMTISVTDNLGGAYTVGTVTVNSSSLISTTVTIPTAPAAKYVTVAVKSSTGTTLASTTLGVASVSKSLATDIQPILDANCSTSCHNTSAAGGLNLNSGITSGSTSMFATSSTSGCSNRYRVSPGDPRRANSVLIDKILVASTGISACAGSGMPPPGNTLTINQISDIIDWVAGGIKP